MPPVSHNLNLRNVRDCCARWRTSSLSAFQSAASTRDAMLNIPARVVNEITALVGGLDAEKSHAILLILQREIHSALEQEAKNKWPWLMALWFSKKALRMV